MTVGIGDIIEGSFRFAHNGANRAMNVQKYTVVSNDALTNQEFCDAITDDIAAIYNVWLASFITIGTKGTSVIWRYYDPVTDAWTVIAESDFNTTGTSLNDGLAFGAAGHVKLPHAGGGRNGSKFVYGLSEGAATHSVINTLPAAALAGWGADMASEVGDLNKRVQPIVLHADKSYHQMVGVSVVDARVGYQRRRKQSVGW